MSEKPLAGKKVGIIVENQYIPKEIRDYLKLFEERGATVELMSLLWGAKSQRFYSTVEKEGDVPETLEVWHEINEAKLEEFAAIVMAANYVSVRLRWFVPPEGQQPSVAAMRTAPAVQFMARAMRDRRLVKGMPCHALWSLTPVPELLAGRKVTCNRVVLADVHNAGAIYIPPPQGVDEEREHVVVDDDLVTSCSYHATEAMVDAITEAVVKADTRMPARTVPRKRVLVLMSEWGYWGEELVGPIEEFDRAGYETVFCTPTGRRPNAITVSMKVDYVDPPLGRGVTTREVAERARAWDDPSTPEGQRLENPRSLRDWMPERPYYSAPNFIREFEAYHRELDRAAASVNDFDALLIVGGSGPIVDLANNQRVHDLVLSFYRANKPVAAECYGIACLAFARDFEERRSILWGKHVTGHCLEYDYHDGTGFMQSRGQSLDFNMGPPPYPLECILRDATGPNGAYHGNFGHETSVIVDYPFITGRSTPDSRLTGQKLTEVLDGQPPLRRWGW